MMHDVAPTQVAPELWRIELPHRGPFLRSVNVYAARSRSGVCLIDSGEGDDPSWESLTRQLAMLGFAPSTVHTIVVTHAHPDHTGLAARFQRDVGTEVLLHKRDVVFAAQAAAPQPGAAADQAAWLQRYGFSRDEAEALVVWPGTLRPTPAVADRPLEGGEIIEAGRYRFEVVWTPGHTPGHVCLYDPTERVLLCGDHILQDVAPNVGLRPGVVHRTANPLPGYLDSLRQISRWAVDVALPGHGTLADLPARASELVRHQIDRQTQVLQLLTATPQTAFELASQVWTVEGGAFSDFKGHVRRNAVGTLAAHLELLADEGRATRTEDEAVRFAKKHPG